MKISISIVAIAGAIVLAVPASAEVITVPLGVIAVPPTQTFSPGVVFTQAGANTGLYEFVLSQAMTITVSSFTNSSIGGTGAFDFSSIGLYSGLGTGGMLLQSGTVVPRQAGTSRAFLDQFTLNQGTYTIAYSGTVTGPPAGVGSSITFAAGAVPEPATWGLMILGLGVVGGAMRRRQKIAVRYAV